MSQTRILDYGSPVVAKTIKTMIDSITMPGRLLGMEFSVDAVNRMKISPGSAVTNQGVIISEDEFKTIQITNTSSPADYTVLYYHVDQDISGGIVAELTLESGLLTSDVVDGVILGYVRYPGGAIPLSLDHFQQSPILQLGSRVPTAYSADWYIPIRNAVYMQTAASGGALTLTDTYDTSGSKPEIYLKIRNNGVSSGSITLTFPFKVKDYKYAKAQIILSADVNATISPVFIDTNGVSTSLLTSPISSVTNLTLQQIEIPRLTNQSPNQIVYLQLLITCQTNREVKLQSVGLTEYSFPV